MGLFVVVVDIVCCLLMLLGLLLLMLFVDVDGFVRICDCLSVAHLLDKVAFRL